MNPAVIVNGPMPTVFISMMFDTIRHTQNSAAKATKMAEKFFRSLFMILVFYEVASTRWFDDANLAQILFFRACLRAFLANLGILLDLFYYLCVDLTRNNSGG